MLKEGRNVVALVRSPADLERACRELAGLLATLRGRGTPTTAERLLGIWMDEQGAMDLPDVLELGESPDASRPTRIVEAMGMHGIWMLYFLESPPASVSRADLLGALLRTSADETSAPGQFIPVFALGTEAACIEAELWALEHRHSSLLLAPLYQDSRTFELVSLAASSMRSIPAAQQAPLH